MARAKSRIALSALALLATTGVASAAPFSATGHEAKSQVEKVDYRRCWIEDGEEVCRYVSDYDELDDEYADDDVYAYEPGPPVILGFGIGGGGFHGHGQWSRRTRPRTPLTPLQILTPLHRSPETQLRGCVASAEHSRHEGLGTEGELPFGGPRDHFARASASKVVFMTAMPCSIMTSIWPFISWGRRSAIHTTRLPSFAPAKT